MKVKMHKCSLTYHIICAAYNFGNVNTDTVSAEINHNDMIKTNIFKIHPTINTFQMCHTYFFKCVPYI